MTDPFSVVAGVVGIVGVALSNTRQVYDFIVGIKGAPETVTTLSGDLDSLANILQQLSDLTQDPSQALFIVPLKGSLERCITALNQLELSIKPYVERLRSGRSKWKRFAWNFKEKEVAALQVRLGSCRENLQLAILLGVMTQQASSSNDIRANFQRLQQAAEGDVWSVAGCDERSSDAQASEYGFALKRFLLEHEPELGSELGDNAVLKETIDGTAAAPSSGMFVTGRDIDPTISRESEVVEPKTRQICSQVTSQQSLPNEDTFLNTLDRPLITACSQPHHHVPSLQSITHSGKDEPTGDSPREAHEARIMHEILAEGLLEGINVDELTEQEEDELCERIAESYRARQRLNARDRARVRHKPEDNWHKAMETDAYRTVSQDRARVRHKPEDYWPKAMEITEKAFGYIQVRSKSNVSP